VEQKKYGLHAHPSYQKNAELFYEKYELLDLIIVGDERYSKRNLKGYTSRTCRFCKRSYPDAKFSNYSHLLPQLIGNSNLYSDFECDDCNAHFSSYENDFAGYLGISRSIAGLHGEKRTPGFTARRMRAKSRSFIGNNILIISPEDIKVDGNTTTIAYTKNPYIPANVYKALLKSSLSILNIDVIEKHYKSASAYLMGKVKITQGAIIGGYHFPFIMNMPLHVIYFKSRVEDEKIPSHVMCFYFQNRIIFFPLPEDLDDLPSKPSDKKIIVPPPFFIDKTMIYRTQPKQFISDLFSENSVLDEEEVINLQLDPKDLENASCYDPVTDTHQIKKYDPAGMRTLILARDGVTVDPKALSTFIREQRERDNL